MDRAEAMKRARLARQGHVLAWHGSGLTQTAYCRRHDINATTFSGWLRDLRACETRDVQLGASEPKQVPLTALAVIVSPEAHAPRMTTPYPTQPGHAALTVTGAGGWQITIDNDSSRASTLKTLAALLVEIDQAGTHTNVDANVSPRR